MIREKPMLICIIGVDGVGKTTHVQKLLDRIKKNRVVCRYAWFRFFHFISLPLLGYCRLANLTIYEMKDGYRIGRHEFYKSKIISFLYPWILFIDMLPIYFIKIYLPLRFGYTVVCDRFVYDTLVDIMIDLRNFKIHKKIIGKLFISMTPSCTRTVLLDLDESIIRERRTDLMNEPSLKMRRRAYNIIAKEFNFPIIKNAATIGEVHEQIVKYVGCE